MSEVATVTVPRDNALRAGRVLVVDDSSVVRAMVGGQLRNAGYDVKVAKNGAKALALLEREPFDVVITDLHMPELDGFGVLEALRQRELDPEVIILTGEHADDMDSAVRALQLGVHDFLTKPLVRPDQAVLSVESAIEKRRRREALREACELAERQRAEEALRKSERQLSEAQRLAHVGSWEWDLATGEMSWSETLFRIHGLSPGASAPTSRLFWDSVHPDDRERVERIGARALEDRAPFTYHYRIVRPDGSVRILHTRGQIELDEAGRPIRLFGTDQDVTEAKQTEEELRIKSEQLQGIAEAMMTFLDSGELKDSSAGLLDAALRQTESGQGFIGVVVEGPALRIVAEQGVRWEALLSADAREKATRGQQESGRLEFADFDNLLGSVVTTRRPVMANQPATDPRSAARLPGHPSVESFLGVPILRGSEVVGMIGVANRRGGYTGTEQAQIEVLTRATGLIYHSYFQSQRSAALEQQLRQAQKMEAVGRLAGGVAHDFNNLLGVITGYGDLLVKEMGPGDPRRDRVEQIRRAADRAASLTRQLLAFSRRQVLQPRVLDLNSVVSEMEKMLRRLVGETIEVVTNLDPKIGRVKADPGQIDQVLMNLVVNARDAMPRGGALVLETARVDFDERYVRTHPGVRTGPHVMLAVSDTGTGMDAETRAHVFEPFFTTKEQGKGTGLGLATVYGIVQQSGGHISLYSEAGRGTTFRILLPQVDEGDRGADAPESPSLRPAAAETVLVVEDEPALREIIREILEADGYAVLEGGCPAEALATAETHQGPIHLLVTDVVMPRMSGPEMAERLEALRSDSRVLYMSGYTDEAIGDHGVLEAGTHFIQKPFSAESLLRKVREVLGEPA